MSSYASWPSHEFSNRLRESFLRMREGRVDPSLIGRILKAIGQLPEPVYYPSDDSFLMLDAISDIPFQGKDVLDIGTGSGILGLFCAMQGANVTISDVNELAIRYALRAAEALGVKLNPVLSDLFSNVNGKFDSVLFNPPYLSSVRVKDQAVDGGPEGIALARNFLRDLPLHLQKNGTAFLLLSNLNRPEVLLAEHPEFQFTVKAKRNLFFEQLEALVLQLRQDFAEGSDS